MNYEFFALIFFALWLIGLTIFSYYIYSKFNRLTQKNRGENLSQILDNILDTEKTNISDIKNIKKRIDLIVDEEAFHFQKMGLLRFNPFSETGGDHSFSLALLDANDTGVVITGLHTRERTRLYVKPIKLGKSEYELSEEEQKALTKAKKKSKS